jgi:Cdc6-like AAA superfamily ATPase
MAKKKINPYALSFEEKMDFIRMKTQAVLQNYTRSILILGSAGIGKSMSVMDEIASTIKEDPAQNKLSFESFTGTIKNAKAFYKILYDHNHKDLILIFDDVNELLKKSSQSVDLMRGALGEDKIRKITFTDSTINEGSKYKSTLNLSSRIIVISNMPKSRIEPAIVSRTNPLEIIITPTEIFEYIKNHLPQCKPRGMPVPMKKEIITFIEKEKLIGHVKHFDFRVFKDLCLFRMASKVPDDWKKFVYNLMLVQNKDFK